MLWLSEISHHFRGDSDRHGWWLLPSWSCADCAWCLRQKIKRLLKPNSKTVDDSKIHYTLPLAGEYPVSSAVVLCFLRDFVTRSVCVL
ncbi:hypothetical protein ACLK19_22565 [Escherichia coli]